MPSKNKSQKSHAKKRFNTRLGISLTPELHRFLIRKIQTNQAIRVEKQSNRISVWDIGVSEFLPNINELRVVYDCNTKNIVTLLFKDGLLV